MLTPSYTNTGVGATALNIAGGMAGFAGAFASDLALAGFEAQPDAIEEALGKMVGAGFDPKHLNDELGARWEITRNYFRLHACCNPIHPALDALDAALTVLRPRAEDVERIEFATYKFASIMCNPNPANYFASKYSLPHAAAVMIVRGKTDHGAIDDTALHDPAIASVRARVSVHEDAAMSSRVPADKPAQVTLALKDGRSHTHAVSSHRGDFRTPYTDNELREKFRDLASEVLTREGILQMENAIDRCEHLHSVGDLAAIVGRCQRECRP
jgi:2-methylcitrate dehydratase PrpD